MTCSIFDTVILQEGILASGPRAGDIGAVVEIHGTDGLEVAFVTGSGTTQALLTSRTSQVRPIGNDDILSVRSVAAA